MKKTLGVLMVAVVVGLAGCAGGPILRSPEISEAQAAKCVQEAPGRMEKAKQGDRYEQYNVGKDMMNGCTAGRIKKPDDGLPWLVASAKQDNLAAIAFLGGRFYGTNALLKHKARQDWSDDESKATQYTDTALALWEKSGRRGFSEVGLEQLKFAVNTRGLIQRFIHEDKVSAEKSYCFVLQVGNLSAAEERALLDNLSNIGKNKTDCR